MSTIRWPSYAFRFEPLAADLAYELQPVGVRADMEAGPARQRRLFRPQVTRVACAWPMTAAEMEMFRAWHQHDLAGGYAWFVVPVLTGTAYVDHEARFERGEFTARRRGGEYVVNAVLEVRSLATPTLAEAAITALGGDAGTAAADDLLHTIVHTDYPGAVP